MFLYPFILFGHLGCAHISTIVNNAVMDMAYKHLFRFLIPMPLDMYLEVGLLEHIVLFLIFQQPSYVFHSDYTTVGSYQQCNTLRVRNAEYLLTYLVAMCVYFGEMFIEVLFHFFK